MSDDQEAFQENAQVKRWSSITLTNVMNALIDQGLTYREKYVEGAEQWCTGSLSFPEHGPDSYGDCAECGEELIWVLHLVPKSDKEETFQQMAERHAEALTAAAAASLPPEDKRRRELWTILEGNVLKCARALKDRDDERDGAGVTFNTAAAFRTAESEVSASINSLVTFEASLL